MNLLFKNGIFHHIQIFVVPVGQAGEIVFQVIKRSVPSRIVGYADNIKCHTTGNHIIEPENSFLMLASQGEVHHHRHVRVDRCYAFHTGFKQFCKVIRITDMAVGP